MAKRPAAEKVVEPATLTQAQIDDYLASWVNLNKVITDIDDEGPLWQLLEHELEMPSPRGLFLLRIHSRINKLRADRERGELMARVANPPLSKDPTYLRKMQEAREKDQNARLKRLRQGIVATERSQ